MPLPGRSVGITKVPSYFLAKASASSRVGNAESCSVYLPFTLAASAAGGLGAVTTGLGGAAAMTGFGGVATASGFGGIATAMGLGGAGGATTATGFGAAGGGAAGITGFGSAMASTGLSGRAGTLAGAIESAFGNVSSAGGVAGP